MLFPFGNFLIMAMGEGWDSSAAFCLFCFLGNDSLSSLIR